MAKLAFVQIGCETSRGVVVDPQLKPVMTKTSGGFTNDFSSMVSGLPSSISDTQAKNMILSDMVFALRGKAEIY